MKVLHHRCGYALRTFERTLPGEAKLLRPHFRAISHDIKRFIGDTGAPSVNWPRWRTKRHESGKGAIPQRERPMSSGFTSRGGTACPLAQGQGPTSDALASFEEAADTDVPAEKVGCRLPELRIDGADALCSVTGRLLKAHLSDESTMAPTASLSDGKSIRRPGRRARARARLEEYHRCAGQSCGWDEGAVTVPIKALCSILEGGSEDFSSDWDAFERRSAEDEDFFGGELEDLTDPTAPSTMVVDANVGDAAATGSNGDEEVDGKGDDHESDRSSRTEPCAAHEICVEGACDGRRAQILDAEDWQYVRRHPPIPRVGDMVWRDIPQDAVNILQRHNYDEPFAQKTKENSAVLLSVVLEAMVGRLQEPCRTPGCGDSGRAWDTHFGCELAMTLIGNLMDEGAFASTIADFRGKLEALGELANGARDAWSAPAQMLAYGPDLQRFQICVQRSRNWRWGSPQHIGEDPVVQDIIHGKSEPRGSNPGGVANPAEGLSARDLQHLLQARLQASRRP